MLRFITKKQAKSIGFKLFAYIKFNKLSGNCFYKVKRKIKKHKTLLINHLNLKKH